MEELRRDARSSCARNRRVTNATSKRMAMMQRMGMEVTKVTRSHTLTWTEYSGHEPPALHDEGRACRVACNCCSAPVYFQPEQAQQQGAVVGVGLRGIIITST